MKPIKITDRLPKILENHESDRVLIWSHGKWEVAWLMDLEDGSPLMWCCDNEQSVDPDPTHWLPLPDQPNRELSQPTVE